MAARPNRRIQHRAERFRVEGPRIVPLSQIGPRDGRTAAIKLCERLLVAGH
jgi:hypothetical protein